MHNEPNFDQQTKTLSIEDCRTLAHGLSETILNLRNVTRLSVPASQDVVMFCREGYRGFYRKAEFDNAVVELEAIVAANIHQNPPSCDEEWDNLDNYYGAVHGYEGFDVFCTEEFLRPLWSDSSGGTSGPREDIKQLEAQVIGEFVDEDDYPEFYRGAGLQPVSH